MKNLVDKLEKSQILSHSEIKTLLNSKDNYLHQRARHVAKTIYGNKIFARGLIEVTNYCKQDCYYCGLRRSNNHVQRYRLSEAQILDCCKTGYNLGFRTFVMQGGEDGHYTDNTMAALITKIKSQYPDCAITLSIGERSRESYKRLYEAGADRYLLRHETANNAHYSQLHPSEMSLSSRKECLQNLKEIGYQVGCGFMVGSPGQTLDHIADDLLFIQEINPAMVGVGPFVPHSSTPFANRQAGDLWLTLNILAILRLMKPNFLLPATTALGSIHAKGREHAVLAGANVIMPNLSPTDARQKYLLYDNKISTDGETAANFSNIKQSMKEIGYEIISARGDYLEI